MLALVHGEVTSPLHGTAWLRISRGVAQWARQSSEFAPEIEGTCCLPSRGCNSGEWNVGDGTRECLNLSLPHFVFSL